LFVVCYCIIIAAIAQGGAAAGAAAVAAAGTGVRDLDSGRPKLTSDREKEGYCYLPQPHFTLTWVSLKDKTFTVQRPGQADFVVPVQLCTVKEVRYLSITYSTCVLLCFLDSTILCDD
jgi:hypothetical protein